MNVFYRKIIVVLIIILLSLKVSAQEKNTLNLKKLDELSDLFYNNINDSLFSLRVAKTYLKKAKLKKDTFEIANGFYFLSNVYKNEEKLFLLYNDSIIFLTKKLKTEFYPVIGYFNKGDHFYEKRELKRSLENYLFAEKHAVKNSFFHYSIKHRIGLLKSRFGKEKEALYLFKDTYNYHIKNKYQEENIDFHLPVVFALSDSYLRNKKIDSAFYYCKIGLDISKKNKKLIFENFFKFEKGLIEFGNGNYKTAIEDLSQSLPGIINYKDLSNVSYANF